MKKFCLIIAALLVGSTLFAQQLGSRFNDFYIQYSTKGVQGFGNYENIHNFNTFTAGYNRGIQLGENSPVYFVPGVNFVYMTKCQGNGQQYTTRKNNGYNIFGTGVPVNFMYHVAISKAWSFEVNAGLNAMYYWTSSVRRDGMEEIDIFCRTDSQKYKFPQAKRFNAGWQGGIKFQVSKVYFGMQYTQDITKFMRDDDGSFRWRGFDFMVGIRF